jgi:hypothetical protein
VGDSVTVLTGGESQMALAGGGKITMHKSEVRAHVAAARPDGARVEAKTTIAFDLPAAGKVLVESQTNVTRSSLLATGWITLNGRRLFDGKWER